MKQFEADRFSAKRKNNLKINNVNYKKMIVNNFS